MATFSGKRAHFRNWPNLSGIGRGETRESAGLVSKPAVTGEVSFVGAQTAEAGRPSFAKR